MAKKVELIAGKRINHEIISNNLVIVAQLEGLTGGIPVDSNVINRAIASILNYNRLLLEVERFIADGYFKKTGRRDS